MLSMLEFLGCEDIERGRGRERSMYETWYTYVHTRVSCFFTRVTLFFLLLSFSLI